MNIYYNGNILLQITPTDESYRYRPVKNLHTLDLYYSLPEHVDIPEGAYVFFEGQTYTLNDSENIKRHGERNLEYRVTFNAPDADLKKYKVQDLAGRLKFTMTAKPHEHLQLIVDNMNLRDSGWSVGTYIDAPEKVIAYNHIYCWDALNTLADECKTEFEINGKQLNLRKVEYNKATPLSLAFGQGNGLIPGVGRTVESKGIEKLYVQGGSRNIDASKYGNTDLLLPKSQTLIYEGRIYQVDPNGLYISRADKPLNTKKEDSLDLTNIYPSRVGTISLVTVVNPSKNFYDIIDGSIPAGLDYEDCLIKGEKMTIEFQTGMLTGKEFEVKYIHADRRFEITPQEIDGQKMPGGAFIPTIGDKYAVFGIQLPAAYISDNPTQSGASWDMFKEAVQYLFDKEDDKFTFTGELDGIWAKQNWLSIGAKIIPGGYVNFTDPDFAPTGVLIRIMGVKDYINRPQSPVLELSNSTAGGTLTSELKKIDANEVLAGDLYNSLSRFTKRRFRDSEETLKMLEEAMLEGFGDSISPITIKTMALLIGDESLQFRFVNNKTAPVEVPNNITYDTVTKVLSCPSAILQHLTIGITNISPEHPISSYKFWDMAAYATPPMTESEKKYYLYAKVIKTGTTGEYVLSETAIDMEGVAGYYHLLIGILNSEYDATRSFVTLYGFTEILPGRITTDKIVSSDGATYFDLANGIIGGRLRFVSSGVEKDVATAISDAESSSKTYSDNKIASLSTGIRNLIRNSSFELSQQNLIQSNGLGSFVVSTDFSAHGSKSLKYSCITSASTSTLAGITFVPTFNYSPSLPLGDWYIMPLIKGKKISASVLVRGVGSSIGKQVFMRLYRASNAFTDSSPITLTDSWQTIQQFADIPLTSTLTTIQIQSSTLVAGNVFYSDNFSITLGNVVPADWSQAPEDAKVLSDLAQAAADAAATAAANAQSSATTANNLLADITSDNKLTAVEKQQLQKEWDVIIGEYQSILDEAAHFGINSDTYYNSLTDLSDFISINALLNDLTTTVNVDGSILRTKFTTVYETKIALLNAISNKSKQIADAAQVVANSAQSTANTAITNAAVAQSAADNAAVIANAAQSAANTANALIGDLTNDNKLTGDEKQQLKREFDIIIGEQPKNSAQGNAYGITTPVTTYNAAYNALQSYITPLLANLSATSDINGADLRSYFKAYTDARTDLLNAITAEAYNRVSNIKVGGANLLQNSAALAMSPAVTGSGTSVLMNNESEPYQRATPDAGANISIYGNSYTYEAGKQYITSQYVRQNSGSDKIVTIVMSSGGLGYTSKSFTLVSGVWTRINVLPFTPGPALRNMVISMVGAGVALDYKKAQIEEGNIVTSYVEHPQDITNRINAGFTAANNFASAQANAAEVSAKAHADNVVDAEEARAIADAEAKANAARQAAIDFFKFRDGRRNDNDGPSYYNTNFPAQEVREFKSAAAIGVYAPDDWIGLITRVPYNDYSGNRFGITQITASSGRTWTRTGNLDNDTWSAWKEQEDIVSNNGKIDAAKAFAQAQDTYNLTVANAYADGKVTAEENARIQEAAAKLLEAKAYAEAQVANIKLGGVNMVRNGRPINDFSYWNSNGGTLELISGGGVRISGNAGNGLYQYVGNLKPDTEYTISLDFMAEVLPSVNTGVGLESVFYFTVDNSLNTWKRYKYTWKTTTHTAVAIVLYLGNNGAVYNVKNVQFEEGNKDSNFSENPQDVEDRINAANTSATNASNAASAAQSAANTANNLLADLANDNKLTATEKQQLKTEWDAIFGEKPKNDAQADTFGVSKTAYGTAYNNLNTYITPLLADLTTTSDITGTTLRSTFKSYTDARTDLLNAIAAKARELANNAQASADLKNRTFNNILDLFGVPNSGIPAEGYSAGDRVIQTVQQSINGKTFYPGKIYETKVTGRPRPSQFQADFNEVADGSAVADLLNDDKVTPNEKQELYKYYLVMQNDYSAITGAATAARLTFASFTSAYSTLQSFISPLVANLTTTSDASGATMRSYVTSYEQQKTTLLNAITSKNKAIADRQTQIGSLAPALEDWFVASPHSIVTISDGKEGSKALRLVPAGGNYPYSGARIPVDRDKAYKTKFWARKASSGTDGVLYFCMRQYDANGNPVNNGNSGYGAYSPAAAALTTSWTAFSNVWKGTTWHADTRFIEPVFLDQYGGSSPYFEIQGFVATDVTDLEALRDYQQSFEDAIDEVAAKTNNMILFEGGVALANVLMVGDGVTIGGGLSGVDAGNANAIWLWGGASYANKGTAPFRVNRAGKIWGSDADISGGKIGGWTLENGGLSNRNGADWNIFDTNTYSEFLPNGTFVLKKYHDIGQVAPGDFGASLFVSRELSFLPGVNRFEMYRWGRGNGVNKATLKLTHRTINTSTGSEDAITGADIALHIDGNFRIENMRNYANTANVNGSVRIQTISGYQCLVLV